MKLKLQDRVKVKGRCRLTVRDLDGEIVAKTGWTPNLVTNDGEELYAKMMKGVADLNPCGFCGVGSGNTGAQKTDWELETEIPTRLEVTESIISTHPFTVTYSTFFGSGDCFGNWWEIGMFNAAVDGVLIARTVLGGAQVKNATNTITCDYELSVV